MKLVKMLGLAMVAALVAMAVLGATTASADEVVLCETKSAPCPGGEILPSGTEVNASLTSPQQATLSPKGGLFVDEVTCQDSEIKGKTKESQSTQGEQLLGQTETVTFENCKDNLGGNCTATPIQLNWQSQVAEENPVTQKTTLKAGEHSDPNNGSPAAEVTCIGITCTYGLETDEKSSMVVNTGANATAVANIQLFEKVPKFLCPEESTWEATYHVTTPNPLWVTHK